MSRPVSTESVFRALAHPTRRRMLLLLAQQETAAGDLSRHFNHSQPVLSRHLRILNDSGLVTYRRRGNRLLYRTVAGAIRPVQEWLAEAADAKPSRAK